MSENIASNNLHEDLLLYSPEHVLEQSQHASEHLGYKILQFYIEVDGTLAKAPTLRTAIFYLSPSGGTLRDEELNIVLYSAKYDLYKGIGKQS
jgi:hypothetical protein